MLKKLLGLMNQGKTTSVFEMADYLNVSSVMVMQMIKELTDKGYLEMLQANCETQSTTCTNCPVMKNCQVQAKTWQLTDKGRQLIQSLN